ncbi:MAG: translation elongation factor 4 [Bacteroidia bacterium]|nr:translation elongation factor 4 [Bacteroidia bacterium]MDW8157595.1 translation elongation factor 4 [Bacteroidia bacterium]
MEHIRNFCIIAHIDHGKSTLADRLLEKTQTIEQRKMMDQVLDDMDLEREKGITIKSHAIQMYYTCNNRQYTLNLIDTPGHVDFSYEVSRAIAACEGALLVVDAAQGTQAQTIANLYLALEHDLTIIPVLNKIDLPAANVEEVSEEVCQLLGCNKEEIILASAKEGIGIDEILNAVVDRIPPPKGDPNAPLKALIFDSMYNSFRGTITYFRIFDGSIKTKDKLKFMATNAYYEADEVGILRLNKEPRPEIQCGDVGYLITGIKEVKDVKVGDTITSAENPAQEPIKGFREVKPMVFAGMYPVDTSEFEDLRTSLEKLQLNDAALVFEPETSAALGFGFRVGFLGMLHMEIVQERLEREFNMTVITTVPNVQYIAHLTNKTQKTINSPADLPEPAKLEKLEEPYIKAQIITKSEYIGAILNLCIDKRGIFKSQNYLTPERVELIFEMPLSEVVFDFYDKLKSVSRGYASLDYELIGFRESDLVKMDILINGDPVDSLSAIIHRSKAYDWGKKLCSKLKELIPRQQFEIPIQAAIGSRVIARETIKALRKDVTAKCYGGDITRKRKLLEKQKEGKKRMRQVGSVEIPQSAFMAVLKLDQ